MYIFFGVYYLLFIALWPKQICSQTHIHTNTIFSLCSGHCRIKSLAHLRGTMKLAIFTFIFFVNYIIMLLTRLGKIKSLTKEIIVSRLCIRWKMTLNIVIYELTTSQTKTHTRLINGNYLKPYRINISACA